jgi:CHAT domain-containing protein
VLEAIARTGSWRKTLNQTFACDEPTPTGVLDQPSVRMSCKRKSDGVPQTIVLTRINGQTWASRGTSSAEPAVARAIGVLSGVLKAETAAAAAPGLTAQRLAGDADATASGDQYDNLRSIAVKANRSGDFVDAEYAYRQALQIHEMLVGKRSPYLAGDIAGLAVQVSAQGRKNEAKKLLDRARSLAEPLALDASLDTVPVDAELDYAAGVISFNEGDYGQALTQLGRAEPALHLVAGGEAFGNAGSTGGLDTIAANTATESLIADSARLRARAELIDTLRHEAAAQRNLHQLDESYAKATEAQALAAGLGEHGAAIQAIAANTYQSAAYVADSRKDATTALADLRTANQLFDTVDPASFVATRSALALAGLKLKYGDAAGARDLCVAASSNIADSGVRLEARFIVPCLDALWSQRGPGGNDAAARKMIELAQLAQSSTTTDQIASTVIRLKQSAGLGALLKRQDEARIELDAAKADANADKVADPSVRQKADERRDVAQRALHEVEESLQAVGYNQIVSPTVSADAILAALHPHEVFVTMLFGDDHGWVFALRDGMITAARSPVGLAEVDALVTRVRKGVEVKKGILPPFDTGASYAIYDNVFGGVASSLQGATSMTVAPTGPLLSVPFAILLTAPSSPHDLITAKWLVKELPLAHVPAAQSFVYLRAAASIKSAPKPFYGFGGFNGITPGQAEASFPANDCPNTAVALTRLPPLGSAKFDLPDIAAMLGAPENTNLSGNAFTVPNILNMKGSLIDYRVLVFDTHAFLPTQLVCESEPALVTNPPQGALDASGALLTASKIATLQLNADLVILNACSTGGAGTEAKGESLSGLAKSFFAAGARSLLVTHWQADAVNAAIIVNEFVKREKDTDFADPATALARAQLSLLSHATRENGGAHPYWWGLFTIVGGGGADSKHEKVARL